MRKTLIAIALGATTLIAAACGPSGSTASPAVGASEAPLESTPLESVDPNASPSDMVVPSESPASS